ncbi:uncharacterized protein LOC127057263 [Gopherus flavomarginatus]|uniref:uncharacterized protein LOC127057263 n=1 Tax=Gopherus flavomarginatus TaxID=286002 RepID=UPI0021CC2777|nr:uncharacterized protein LOC127057263 [Gopherus flavomarginatus]
MWEQGQLINSLVFLQKETEWCTREEGEKKKDQVATVPTGEYYSGQQQEGQNQASDASWSMAFKESQQQESQDYSALLLHKDSHQHSASQAVPKEGGAGERKERKKEDQACTVSSEEEEDLKQWQAIPATITPYRSEVTDPQTFLLLYSIGSTAEQLEDEVCQRWRGTNQEEDRNKELDQESFPRMDDISSVDGELRHGILKEMRGIKLFKLRGS